MERGFNRPPSGGEGYRERNATEGDGDSTNSPNRAQWGAEDLRTMLQRQRQEKQAQIEVH
jgi:hypothetical protein